MYIAIDVETSGVDPLRHQILEIAAVAWDSDDINTCSYFRRTVDPRWGGSYIYSTGDIVGEPRALIMNQRLIKEIGEGEAFSPREVSKQFRNWCTFKGPLHAVGLNFGGFDWQFLKQFPDFPKELFGYRFVEIGSLLATKNGPVSAGPALGATAEKHGIEGRPHEALFDARCTLAFFVDHLNAKDQPRMDTDNLRGRTFTSSRDNLTTYQMMNSMYTLGDR